MVMDAVCGARLVSEIGLCVSRRVLRVCLEFTIAWKMPFGCLFLQYFYSFLLHIVLSDSNELILFFVHPILLMFDLQIIYFLFRPVAWLTAMAAAVYNQ